MTEKRPHIYISSRYNFTENPKNWIVSCQELRPCSTWATVCFSGTALGQSVVLQSLIYVCYVLISLMICSADASRGDVARGRGQFKDLSHIKVFIFAPGRVFSSLFKVKISPHHRLDLSTRSGFLVSHLAPSRGDSLSAPWPFALSPAVTEVARLHFRFLPHCCPQSSVNQQAW